jgi:putative peptidoglycan lipid II flippase
MSENRPSDNLQIARAAGIVMGAFVLSNLIGLARQILVSNTFGTQVELDAFNAAATYPDLIFSLVAGGALASAFVPTLTGFLTRGDRRGGWFLSSSVINIVFLILTGLSLVSAWLSPWIVATILTPDYSPELQALTSDLLRILLLAPAIFGVSGLFMGILNAHQVFLWPALAPSMLWLGMIFGVIFLAPQLGIFGLAWGYVLGAALHLVIQVPGLLRLPARQYFATLGLRFAAVREVGRLMGPRLLGVAAVQINFVINTILATGMAVGSLASIKYAWAVMTMPQVVIAQAIAIAALPTFSAQVARGELGQMRTSLSATLRGVILLSLPATCGLVLLRVPITAFLFQRGAFTQDSTQMVAWALLWYGLGLIGHGLVEILSRAFYAMHNTKTPVLVGIGAMSLNVLLSLVFAGLFEEVGWMSHGGLALANSLATALEMVVLWILMRRRLQGMDGKSILDSVLKSAAAALVMSIGMWGWLQLTSDLPVWLITIGGVILGAVIYGGLVFLMRVKEARALANILVRRLRTLT